MNLENLRVKHKSFGEGVVSSNSGKYITVKFASAEKVFVYPDIFEKFLTLEDGSVSEDILKDIEASRAVKQRILDKKNEENIRAMTKGIVVPGRETGAADGEDEENRSKHSETEEV